ncbi:MAG: arsenical pump-driving ATPase, partial [Proteobacteria bacterium]
MPRSSSEKTRNIGEKGWNDKQILFVSGKGGVGKSLVAAGLARELAKSGKRVLLAEIGETSYYKDFWNLPSIGHEPVKHPEGFDVALWSGETSLREYVLFYLKMDRLYSLFFDNKVMRSLVNVAPGLSEIAILGKITSGIRKVGPPLNYDTIIIDSFATGHALALLQAPKGMMEAIKFGPMGHHSREMDAVIKNPKQTGYIVVTLLEELPVTESLEFRETLRRELGVSADIVAN